MLARWDPFRHLDAVGVTFEDGTLTVTGKRELSNEEKGENWHRMERSYGTFTRSIRLPQTADPERIDATFDEGVLSLSVAKVERANPRMIEVRTK